MSFQDLTKAGIDVYMSQGTADALGATGHRIKIVRAGKQVGIGTFAVLPFETEHDAPEPLGFLLASEAGGKLLYLTDSAYCRYRFRGLTHIMLECNYAEDILRANVANGSVPAEMKRRLLRTHFSLESVKELLRANDLSRVREIWLMHISSSNGDAAFFKKEVQKITGKPVFIA